MSDDYIAGQEAVIPMKYSLRNPPASQVMWTFCDGSGELIDAGTASTDDGSNKFTARFTIPSDMDIPNGSEECSVVFSYTAKDGKQIEYSVPFNAVREEEEWQPFGQLVYKNPSDITAEIAYPSMPIKLVSVIQQGYGDTPNIISSSECDDPVLCRQTSRSFIVKAAVPNVSLKVSDQSWFPFQLIVTASFTDRKDEITSIPIYLLTPTTLSYLTSLKRYLDKARLVEIDRNIGWEDEELFSYLLDGVRYVNGTGEATYWTIDKWPANLITALIYAAAYTGLNARYMAEGYIAFDFQGASTSLSVDRRDTISTKMSELESWLSSNLPKGKSDAIRTNGQGTVPAGALGGVRNNGLLGITYGATTNSVNWWLRSPYTGN